MTGHWNNGCQFDATTRNQSDLDQAARHLANFIAVVGVTIVTALVMKDAGIL